MKKVATFASKAALDKRICQGEIARISALTNAMASRFLSDAVKKILLVKRYVRSIVSVPKNAEGNLTVHSLRPNTLTTGAVR